MNIKKERDRLKKIGALNLMNDNIYDTWGNI